MEVHFPIVLQLMHYAVRCACAVSYWYFTEFAATLSPDLTSLDFHMWDYVKNFMPEM
jgi:hypothetical protein